MRTPALPGTPWHRPPPFVPLTLAARDLPSKSFETAGQVCVRSKCAPGRLASAGRVSRPGRGASVARRLIPFRRLVRAVDGWSRYPLAACQGQERRPAGSPPPREAIRSEAERFAEHPRGAPWGRSARGAAKRSGLGEGLGVRSHSSPAGSAPRDKGEKL